jgi:hypothetical protein
MFVGLNVEESELVRDAIAAEIARCLMRENIDTNESARNRFESYVALGRKFGMEL